MKRKFLTAATFAAVFVFFFSAGISGILASAPQKSTWEKETEKNIREIDGQFSGSGCSLFDSGKTLRADSDKITVILECGKSHSGFAEQIKDAITEKYPDEASMVSIKGSRLYMTANEGITLGNVFTSLLQVVPKTEDGGCMVDSYISLLPKEQKNFSSYGQVIEYMNDNQAKAVEDNQVFYVFWLKPLTQATVSIDAPKCGEEIVFDQSSSGASKQKPTPKLDFSGGIDSYSNVMYSYSKPSGPEAPDAWFLQNLPEDLSQNSAPDFFSGTIKGGDTYYLYFPVLARFGYYLTESNLSKITFKNMKCEGMNTYMLNNIFAPAFYRSPIVFCSFRAEHDWDAGKVTKKATYTAEGKKLYTCRTCGQTKTEKIAKLPAKDNPNKKGADGTALGKGASQAAAGRAITGMKNDNDPKGAKFAPLKLKSTKQTKKAVKITWKKVSGATKYVIYGNACGKKNKMKKLATVTGKSKTFKKVAGKKVKKATYYKFIVVALNKKGMVVSTSKVVHAATRGKAAKSNHRGVKISKKVLKKAKALKKGKSLKLSAKPVAAKKTKVAKHVAMRYESTNTKIATVSAKGVIKAKAKGKCKIYAYSQNGIAKAVTVVVK